MVASSPLSDSDLLSSLGLSESAAQELLSSADQLIETYGADTTVEQFLQMQCEKHVSALRGYCEQRIASLQAEAAQQIAEVKANFAQ